jgi:hypothetical protein
MRLNPLGYSSSRMLDYNFDHGQWWLDSRHHHHSPGWIWCTIWARTSPCQAIPKCMRLDPLVYSPSCMMDCNFDHGQWWLGSRHRHHSRGWTWCTNWPHTSPSEAIPKCRWLNPLVYSPSCMMDYNFDHGQWWLGNRHHHHSPGWIACKTWAHTSLC